MGFDGLVDGAVVHEIAPFLPADGWAYTGNGTPVRAHVSANWPKLFGYLDRNAGNVPALLAAIPKIEALKCRGLKSSYLSKDDQKAGRRVRLDAMRVGAANRAARTQQLSTQRGAWGVCKA